MPDRVVAAAATYWYRASPGLYEAHGREAASACLLLASKICEEPRRLRDVLNAVELAMVGEYVRDAHDYWARKEHLVAAEQTLLRSIGFDTSFEDRQVMLLNVLHHLQAPMHIFELSISLLNDFQGRAACEEQPTRVVVAAAISLSAALLEMAETLPVGWSRALEVEPDAPALAATCHAILDVYGRSEHSMAAAAKVDAAMAAAAAASRAAAAKEKT